MKSSPSIQGDGCPWRLLSPRVLCSFCFSAHLLCIRHGGIKSRIEGYETKRGGNKG